MRSASVSALAHSAPLAERRCGVALCAQALRRLSFIKEETFRIGTVLMNDAIIQQLAKLIGSHTGLHIREQDRDALRKKILTRMKTLKLSAEEEYYSLLEAGTV